MRAFAALDVSNRGYVEVSELNQVLSDIDMVAESGDIFNKEELEILAAAACDEKDPQRINYHRFCLLLAEDGRSI